MQVFRTADIQHLNLQRLMIQATALIALCLFADKSLHAADWDQFRGTAYAPIKVYVDGNSVEIDRDTVVKGWVKIEYFSPQTRDGFEMMSHSTYRMMNCETRRYWVVEDWANLTSSMEPVRLDIGNAQEWRMPTPGTESEMALDALCYEARSLLGVLWDKIKEHYENAKAEQEAAGQ